MAKGDIGCKTTQDNNGIINVLVTEKVGNDKVEVGTVTLDPTKLGKGIVQQLIFFGAKTVLQNAKAGPSGSFTGEKAVELITTKRDALLEGRWTSPREGGGKSMTEFEIVLRAAYEALGKDWDEEAFATKYEALNDKGKLAKESRKNRQKARNNDSYQEALLAHQKAKAKKIAGDSLSDDEL